ncbi:TetR/AcrR family transcriptional regulator [Halobacillus sp. Marseille-P3879]|uniref:TetR/AcrR family transcriptional regulator n=1 Tax=Halobacillus sp. Marseille-P3879 TaxID=2045014 RepID=UPI001357C5C1|nr:TetR/AcrR family transcriptional regulator [Halobacillus sp. Marseille-P3879]
MTTLTRNKIITSALHLFIEKGYNGTSLTDIGEDVGIKKQSIYAHFKNKDDLFLQVMEKIIKEEITFLRGFFEQEKNESIDHILYHFIVDLKSRYKSGGRNIKFLLQMMFLPPRHLEEHVITKSFTYYNQLHTAIEEIFKVHQGSLGVDPEDGAVSFLNFIDGLLVELIYNHENFEKRFTVAWAVYWRGIKK